MEATKIQMLEQMAAELTSKIAELTSRRLQTTGQYPGGPFNSSLCQGYDYYLDSCEVAYGSLGGSSGDTSFLTLSSAIVLMMTIPGLGLYYGGMVKVTNVLATVMQCFSIVCLV